MYCSQCGRKAGGKFCWNCGARLAAFPGGDAADDDDPPGAQPGTPPGPPELSVVSAEMIAGPSEGWDHEVCYESLVRLPVVRSMIDRSAALARKGLSGEEFLAMCDKLIPLGVSLEGLAGLIQPLYGRLGIGMRKQAEATLPAPVGRVIVRAICSLARNGQSIRGVRQAADGCHIEAVLPSDLFALEGDLLVSIRRAGRQTQVTAGTKLTGQLFDWGKSRRALDRFFHELKLDPAA